MGDGGGGALALGGPVADEFLVFRDEGADEDGVTLITGNEGDRFVRFAQEVGSNLAAALVRNNLPRGVAWWGDFRPGAGGDNGRGIVGNSDVGTDEPDECHGAANDNYAGKHEQCFERS